jgi:hypothetical protein
MAITLVRFTSGSPTIVALLSPQWRPGGIEQPSVKERIAIMRRWTDLDSDGIEPLAVAAIAFTIVFASVTFV